MEIWFYQSIDKGQISTEPVSPSSSLWPTLETSAIQIFYGGNSIFISTGLIKPNIHASLSHSSTTVS